MKKVIKMSEFLTDLNLHLSHISEKVWILNTPLIYNSDLVGQIIVPAGFNTDLASVPRVPIIFSMWGSRAHYEATIHDYLFRSDSKPSVTFNDANKVLLEAMKVRMKPWYICYPMYWGVCIGSSPYWCKRKVNAEIVN